VHSEASQRPGTETDYPSISTHNSLDSGWNSTPTT